jgi:hypothetical protein
MDPFVAWNLCLLRAFFSAASAGEEVWLALDPDELDVLGAHLGGDAGFLDAVRQGPQWETLFDGWRYYSAGGPRDLCSRAQGLLRQRWNPKRRPASYVDPGDVASEYAGMGAPSYLPILAALVRGCAEQRDAGYYERLQAALGLDSTFGPTQMSEIDRLWKDLEAWSSRHKAVVGRFAYRQLGGFRWIGIPRSQSIVSRRDAQMLPRVFAQVGVRPGQRVSDGLLRQVREVAAEATFLSRPLRDAIGRPEFEEPVNERLRSLLDDWDGVVPPRPGSDTAAPGRSAGGEARPGEIEVALSLAPGNELPWRVRWRVPGFRDAGTVALTRGASTWTARFTGDSTVTTNDAPHDAGSLLAQSASEDVVFASSLSRGAVGASSEGTQELVLRHRPLRTFVLEVGGDDGNGAVLVERGLRAHGDAYLLSAPRNVQNVRRFLTRNAIPHQDCPSDGLPDGWLLVHIPDCAAIEEGCRDELPDGLDVRSRPRAVRLVGGCQIQRAGLRQFLPYDLPAIELDAPPDAEVRAAGLTLCEQPRPASTAFGGLLASHTALRRFDIRAIARDSRSFEVEAISGGRVIGTARLRVAPGDGLASAAGAAFSLDPLGNPTHARGLSGALLADLGETTAAPEEQRLMATPGRPVDSIVQALILALPAVEFLDALAQRGTLSYGSARDLARRLVARSPAPERYDALEMLRELRARGFLEIEADAKGRWVRVHRAPPALCVLPVRTAAGHVVVTVAGTLRMQHWEDLCTARVADVQPYVDGVSSSLLPTLRLTAESVEVLRAGAVAAGLEIAQHPGHAIACWAADLDTIRTSLERAGVESLGAGARAAEWYKAPSGMFGDAARGGSLAQNISHQLLRLDDLETGRHRLYSLAFRDAHGTPRYAFVRDSRWGCWAALVAFGRFVRECYQIQDAWPWPIEYSRRERTVWIPGRISLPVVLERALVLCSGDRPLQRVVSRAPGATGLILECRDGYGAVGGVSWVYDKFVPERPGRALWLGYRWVPEATARAVAARLGGQLRYIDE